MRDDVVLSVRKLSLDIRNRRHTTTVLDNITIHVRRGEIIGLVGESGSGKSLTSLAIMGLLNLDGKPVLSGEINVLGRNIPTLSETELRRMRGTDMAMVFQEPMTALNPAMRIGDLMADVILSHQPGIKRGAARTLAGDLLAETQIHDVVRVLHSYPFELSGGMRQRILIALAFSCRPKLLIADEPTTALDVTVQAQVLNLLKKMAKRHDTAVLFISHDLAVVSETCSRIYVMKDGKIIEAGPVRDVLSDPGSSYTKGLLAALPDFSLPRRQLPVEGVAHPTLPSRRNAAVENGVSSLLDIKDLHVDIHRASTSRGGKHGSVSVLKGVNLSVRSGTTLGIVGESGCGKSTLARSIMGLVHPTSGSIRFRGLELSGNRAVTRRKPCQDLQMVFQDPYSSLNPRMRVWEILTEPLLSIEKISRNARRDRAAVLADQVGLQKKGLDRYPHAFSGGQRQRIALARALATEPSLLILDEPTSALDVSIQAQILNLLLHLQDELGLTYLFISHDLAVVRHMADEVIVMRHGEVVEAGETGQVLGIPEHPYTRKLVAAVPRLVGVNTYGTYFDT